MVVGECARNGYRVTNVGGGRLTGSVTAGPEPTFRVVSGSFDLGPEEAQNIVIEFCPLSVGEFEGSGQLMSNTVDGNPLQNCSYIGRGTPTTPTLSVSPESLDFGQVQLGRCRFYQFVVTNIGAGTLTGVISASEPFSVQLEELQSFSLGLEETHLVSMQFCPTSLGQFSSSISVSSNGGSASVPVSGEGVF